MSAICLLDTSVFCNVVHVPGRCQDKESILQDLRRKIKGGETLLLPTTCVIETGNHIAHQGDGRVRRQTAQRFVREVEKALAGESPFTPTPMFEAGDLRTWLQEFPDWVSKSSDGRSGPGFGDLTILKEFERQCGRNPSRRVYIWSLDHHLASWDRKPEGRRTPGSQGGR